MPKTRSNIQFFFIILLTISAGQIAIDLYLPSLPAITEAFSTTNSNTQLTITIYLLGLSFSQLIYGPLSDHYGRRAILLIGFAISFIGATICVFTPSITALIAARLLQGVGAGAANPVSRAVMRDVFSGHKLAKISSYVGTFIAIILALAPIIGGYLQAYFGWRANFSFLALYGVALWLVILLFLPETNKHIDPHPFRIKRTMQKYFSLLSNPIFIGYTLCTSLTYAGIIAYITAGPFLYQNILGLSPVQYGWLAIFTTLSFTVGAFINARYVTNVGMNRMLFINLGIQILAGMSLLIVGLLGHISVISILVPMMFILVSAGSIFPNASTGAILPFAKMAGTAGALFGFIQVFTGALLSGLVAAIHEENQIPLALILLGLSITTLCALYFLVHLNRSKLTEEII